MIKLNFVIDESYLITHTLQFMSVDRFSSFENKDDIVAFQDFAWKKSSEIYNILVGRMWDWPPETFSSEEKIRKLVQGMQSYLRNLQKSKEFRTLLKQTENYRKFVEKQWKENYKETHDSMKQITGLGLNKSFKVYITHPSLRNGVNLSRWLGKNIIAWGHHEDWSNYSTVYLWHEILHSYLPFTDEGHAVIELITDNELRVRLNGGKYPPLVSHPGHERYMRKILPRWRKYLAGEGEKDIKGFLDSVLK